MSQHYQNPLELEDILSPVISLLELNDFSEARLVCRTWNRLAPPFFRVKVRTDVKVLDHQDIDDVEPLLLSNLNFDFEPVIIGSREHSLACETVFQHLERRQMHQNVRDILLSYRNDNHEEMEDFVSAVNRGLFPNLNELEIRFFEIWNQSYSKFLPRRLTNLKSLRLLLCGEPNFTFRHPTLTRFSQSLIYAAPKIKALYAQIILDLRYSKELTRLEMAAPLDGLHQLLEPKFLEMLEGVANQLEFLSLKGFSYFYYTRSIPVFPNVKELRLISNALGKIWNIQKLFPKLEKLHASNSKDSPAAGRGRAMNMTEGEEPAVIQYLKTKPENLCVFVTSEENLELYVGNDLIAGVPNLEKLIVRESQQGNLNLIVNLNCPLLIYEMTEDCRISTLINRLDLAELIEGVEKGGILKFYFPKKCFHHEKQCLPLQPNSRAIDADTSLKFISVVEKLARKWNLIRLKYFKAEYDLLKQMESDRRNLALPVELYCGVF